MTFLRLFAAYRDLEERLKSSERVAERLNAQCEELRQQNVLLFTRIDESHKSEIRASEKVADFVAKHLSGRGVFDTVIDLPVAPKDMKPIQIGKPHASDLVRKAEREFIEAAQGKSQVGHARQNDGYGMQ